MVRQLEDINASGELVSIKKGGSSPLEEVVTVDDIDQLVPEAPVSSVTYVRQNRDWVPETVQPNPSNGEIYGRRNNIWEIINSLGATKIQQLEIASVLIMAAADIPERLGTVLRVGNGGVMEYYRLVDQDTKWTDTNILDVNVTTVNSGPIVTVTPDQPMTVIDGSFSFMCRVDNNDSQTRTITFEMFIDGVLVRSEDTTVEGNTTGHLIGFSGGLLNDIAAGLDVTMEAHADDPNAFVIRGTQFTTTFTLTKAFTPAATSELLAQIAAERAYVDLRLAEAKVPVFVSPSSFGQKPDKAELTALISGQLDANRTCIATDSHKVWRVFFDGTDYYYEELTKAN